MLIGRQLQKQKITIAERAVTLCKTLVGGRRCMGSVGYNNVFRIVACDGQLWYLLDDSSGHRLSIKQMGSRWEKRIGATSWNIGKTSLTWKDCWQGKQIFWQTEDSYWPGWCKYCLESMLKHVMINVIIMRVNGNNIHSRNSCLSVWMYVQMWRYKCVIYVCYVNVCFCKMQKDE